MAAPRTIPCRPPPQWERPHIWTDAACDPTTRGRATLGGVLLVGENEVLAWHLFLDQLPPEWQALIPLDQQQTIAQLEALAMVVATRVWCTYLRDRRATLWLDNAPAFFALVKGYSSSDSLNELVRLEWVALASSSCDPWFRFVYSENNPADGVSRGDWTLADLWGWTRLSTPHVIAALGALACPPRA